MARRSGKKYDKTGRSQNDQYCKLSYNLVRSDALRCLSGPGLKVLMELRCRFNRSNNGRIILSYEEGSRFLGISKTSVKRAFDELAKVGFIKLKKQGQWYGRMASEWIVTFVPLDGNPPTNDWQHWRSPKPIKPTKKTIPRYPNGTPATFDDIA